MLLENITIGYNIKSEEPFLTALIEHLVDSIKGSNVSKDIKLIQTSILTNLCFKNEMAVACLLRFTKSKDLLHTIHDMRILWCKIAVGKIILKRLSFSILAHLSFQLLHISIMKC